MPTISDCLKLPAHENVTRALKAAKENQDYNALISLTEERALERAKMVDSGEISGKLAGVPFVVKDNFLAYGAPTTAASRLLENFDAPLQATVVEKLEAEGAICIGKANLDAFAHGGSTENSAFGPTKNAVDTTRVAGGSSGGSAVVTALDIVPFALGTDTGGSIRQPASFNGVVGVKPTYGMSSRYGVVAMASSTDVMGCFSQNVADSELVLSIMSGRDERDMTTYDDYFTPDSSEPSPKKVGIIHELMAEGVDSEVRDAVLGYANRLRAKGHTVEEVSLPMIRYSLAMYYIVVPAEISSNLARYDGIRYGVRSDSAKNLAEVYGKSRDSGFMPENERRIMLGSFVLSSGYFDAYYLKAQKARTLLINEFNQLFSEYDVLLSPTAPTTAFKLGEKSDDPVAMYLADAMTVAASLAGIPAMSVPAGADGNGLPIGAQLMARQKEDALMLALAKQTEEQK